MLKKIILILGLVASTPAFVDAASSSSNEEQQAPRCCTPQGSQGCDFNIVDAAFKQHISCVEALLLNRDIQINEARKGKTALHHAARNGNLQLIHMLIQSGADVNAQDNDEKTPLEYLLEAYDNPPAALNEEESQNRPEAFAHMVTNLIQDHHAVVPENKKNHTIVIMQSSCTAQNPCGNNIYLACFLGHQTCVQRLILRRVNLSDEGTFWGGENPLVTTPLHWAAMGGHYEVIKLLLESNTSLDINEVDSTGTTPLVYVSEWKMPTTKKLPMASVATRKTCIQKMILLHKAKIPMTKLPDNNSQEDYNMLLPGSLTEQVCLDLATKPTDDPLFQGMSPEEIEALQASFKEVETSAEWHTMLAYSRHAANAGIVIGAGALLTDAVRNYAHAQRALKIANNKNRIRMTPWQLRLRSCLNAWKQFKAKPLKDKKLFLFGLTSLTTGALMRWLLAAQTPAANPSS